MKNKKLLFTPTSKISTVLIERATTQNETNRLEYNKKYKHFFNKLIAIKNIKKNTFFNLSFFIFVP